MSYSHAKILYHGVGTNYGLIWAPTDLTAAAPYGGTVLGYTEQGVTLVLAQEWTRVVGEESGAATLDLRYAGTRVTLSVVLKQTDDTVLQRAFPGGLTATGSTSAEKNIVVPGTLNQGASGRDNAGVLLFAPVDVTNGKIVLLRVAAPHLEETARLQHSLRTPKTYGLVFEGLEDTSISSANARYASRTAFVGNILDTSI